MPKLVSWCISCYCNSDKINFTNALCGQRKKEEKKELLKTQSNLRLSFKPGLGFCVLCCCQEFCPTNFCLFISFMFSKSSYTMKWNVSFKMNQTVTCNLMKYFCFCCFKLIYPETVET